MLMPFHARGADRPQQPPKCLVCQDPSLSQSKRKALAKVHRHNDIINTSRTEAGKFGFQWHPSSPPEGSTSLQKETSEEFQDFTQTVSKLTLTTLEVETLATPEQKDGSEKKDGKKKKKQGQEKPEHVKTQTYMVSNQGVLAKYGNLMNVYQKELLKIQGLDKGRDQRRYFRFRNEYMNTLQSNMRLVEMENLMQGYRCKAAFYSIVTHENKEQSATLYCVMSQEIMGFKFLRISCEDNPRTKNDTFETVRVTLVANINEDSVYLPPVPAKLLTYLDNNKKSEIGKMIYKMAQNYNNAVAAGSASGFASSASSGNVGIIAMRLQD